ncbi:GTP-binding protein [Nymphaea thermarum]|nr:GTP-binding protein [Nymphaea thermarum]
MVMDSEVTESSFALPPSFSRFCCSHSRARTSALNQRLTLLFSSSEADKQRENFVRRLLFVPLEVAREEMTEEMILHGYVIFVVSYAGPSQIMQVEFVKSSSRVSNTVIGPYACRPR